MSMACEMMEREVARYGAQCPAREEGVGVKDGKTQNRGARFSKGQRRSAIIKI